MMWFRSIARGSAGRTSQSTRVTAPANCHRPCPHATQESVSRPPSASLGFGSAVPVICSGSGRRFFERRLSKLPSETQRAVKDELELLDQVVERIAGREAHVRWIVAEMPSMQRRRIVLGGGANPAILLTLGLGRIERLPSTAHLASCAGTASRIRPSGGHTVWLDLL